MKTSYPLDPFAEGAFDQVVEHETAVHEAVKRIHAQHPVRPDTRDLELVAGAIPRGAYWDLLAITKGWQTRPALHVADIVWLPEPVAAWQPMAVVITISSFGSMKLVLRLFKPDGLLSALVFPGKWKGPRLLRHKDEARHARVEALIESLRIRE